MWILSRAYVNSHFSQEQEEESSVDIYLVGQPSAQWNATLTPRPSSSKDKTTTSSNHSLFGTMSARLTASLGKGKSISSPEDSLAKTSLAQEKAQESKTDIVPVFGVSLREPFAKYDRNTRSWKTPHCLFDEELKSFSAICPKWGMMLRGVCSELTTSEHLTQEKEFGCSLKVGTPTATMRVRSKAFRSGNRTPNPAELAQKEIGGGYGTIPNSASNGRDALELLPSITRETLRQTSERKPRRASCIQGINSKWWSTEPGMGRVAYGMDNRVDRLRCIGNGQVPLCAATAVVQLKHILNLYRK